MKTASLTIYKDDHHGLLATGCAKIVDSSNLKVLGRDWIALDNIYDQPDQCDIIYPAGGKVPANTPGSLPLTKVLIGSVMAWVLEPPREIATIYRDCCLSDNPAPVVSLGASNTAPAIGATITLTATASDNGSIAKVQFFEGDTFLGEDAATAFTQSIVGITAGPHTYVAKAIDNLGKIKYSNIVVVNAS